MRTFLEICWTGVVAVLLHPLRSLASGLAVTVVLTPFLAGIGLSQGIQRQAEASVSLGADLYVTARRLGREAPIPLQIADQLRRLDGVQDVIPRIIGDIALGKDKEHAVLLGIPLDHHPPDLDCMIGRLPAPSSLNELVLGTEIAQRLGLQIGSVVPPFYHNREGEHLSQVVGLFRPDAPIWQARLILTRLETASIVFDQHGFATDLLVHCKPGTEDRLRSTIIRTLPNPGPTGAVPITLAVTTRQDLSALLPRGLLSREGIFDLHFLLAFVLAILVLLVTSGFGLGERRREIGILKATGWHTDQVLLRGVCESLVICVVSASTAVMLAYVWLRLMNGYWIASIFLPGAQARPTFRIPFQLTPLPALLGLLLALAIVLTGTIYSSWRAAIARPREAMSA